MIETVTEEVNQFTQLLIDFGCDVTKMPHNQIELGVLWIKYSWAVFLLGFGFKALMRLMNGFVQGGRV